MKKVLIIVGSIGVLYVFISYVLPTIIAVPLAAYHSKQAWSEYEKESSKLSIIERDLDSIGNFPFPIGSVSDYENVFNESQVQTLTTKILAYEQKTTREIAIVTVPSIEPYEDITDYTTDLANQWGIGNPETDNGLLIVFSKNLHEIRISTGLGTQKKLTDKMCKTVIDQTIIPEFKNGDFYMGIEKGMNELIKLWK